MTVRRWLLDVPTRIHLWSAERELRTATIAADSPARLHNLDLLRDYRRGRAFPRHERRRPVPCFVDDEGRHCAVAHLMARSGEHDAVGRITAADNFARLREMDLGPLRDWQRRSGLSTGELARIQPAYRPEADIQAAWFAFFLLVLSPFALLSIVLNLVRLAHGRLRSSARVAGIAVGALMLVCVAVIAGIDLAHAERQACGLMSPPIRLCDQVTPTWPLVLPLGAIGLAALAAAWYARRRALFWDELTFDD